MKFATGAMIKMERNETIEAYVGTRQEQERLAAALADKEAPWKQKILELKMQMEEATTEEKQLLTAADTLLGVLQTEILEEWTEENNTVTTMAGHSLSRRTRTTMTVIDEERLVDLSRAFERRPYGYTWDSKQVKALVDNGVFPRDAVEVEEKASLALKLAKEE